jgi:hypothetical protein
MHWQLLIEEFGPKLTYIKGENNIVADALSRMAMTEADFSPEAFAADEHDFPEAYPLSFKDIAFEQSQDEEVQELLKKHPDKYKKVKFKHLDDTYKLVTFTARSTCLRSFRRRLRSGTTSTCVTRETLVPSSPWPNIIVR